MASIELLSRPVLAALAVIAVVPLVTFLSNLVRQRLMFWRLRQDGKPMPPHSFFLGHLWRVKRALDTLPPQAHAQYAISRVGESVADRGAWYFDCWPAFSPAMLMVTDPAILEQVMMHPVVGSRKPKSLIPWIKDISGGPSMFVENGHKWEHVHDILAPCFSTANIEAEMPVVMENIGIFKRMLRQKAETGERFELEGLCKRLVIDNTGNLVMNSRLSVLTKAHPLAEAMIYQLKMKANSYEAGHVLRKLSPFHIYKQWNNDRTLDMHIRKFLTERFAELKKEDDLEAPGFKSCMDQIVKDYIRRNPSWTTLDEEATLVAIRNLRTLFFVSYDSTAASIASSVLLLWKHPSTLARLRAELDNVLGKDPTQTADLVASNPKILNSLPYTLAVVKETLRMYPPAGGIREGDASLVLRNPTTGETFPTAGFGVQVSHWYMHHNPKYWIRPHEFLPDRWLVQPGHELYPVKGAWRPFEYGARSCIGQQLVLTELKAFLACVVREFDFEDCYEEIYGRMADKADLSGVGGQELYLVESGSAHPRGGIQCRVKVRV